MDNNKFFLDEYFGRGDPIGEFIPTDSDMGYATAGILDNSMDPGGCLRKVVFSLGTTN